MDATEKTETTPVKDVEVEIIESDGAGRYVPNMSALERRAKKDGNLAPVVLNMEANGASQPQIVEKVLDITVTGELKKAMSAPSIYASASGKTVTTAAAIAEKLTQMAMNGNLGAIKELLNRTEGKVPNVTKNTSAKITATGSLSDLMARIDNNNKG